MTEDSMTVLAVGLDDNPGPRTEAGRSAVSWAAILAGAATAVTTSLILLAIGAGFGLASISPWSTHASVTTFTVIAAIWLIVVQWIASLMGGYITGRLRTKWVGTHTHEVFFRDTAHGFLTWSAATLIAVVFLSSSAVTTVGAGAGAAANTAGADAANGTPAQALAYDVDALYRSTRPEDPSMTQARAEASTILTASAVRGGVSPVDRAYLVQLVVARTGVAVDEAQTRVDNVIAREDALRMKAVDAAEAARKAGAAFAIITALSMLIGALIASVAAALGGQLRDEHP